LLDDAGTHAVIRTNAGGRWTTSDDYVGPATIVGYTVVFAGGEPSHAIAYCDTPAGERTVVRSEERSLLDAMMRDEFCGRTVEVTDTGGFTPVSRA